MHDEQINEAWWTYLKDTFDSPIRGDELPIIFREPHCGTCSYWFLINNDGLDHVSKTSSPAEYDEIIKGLSGKRLFTYQDSKITDGWFDYRFYGWCKRFPPVQRSEYSILRFRSLFSFLIRRIHYKVAEYDFPLMPHDCSCGEWKRNKWVLDFINRNK
jgi:hypothetical protein